MGYVGGQEPGSVGQLPYQAGHRGGTSPKNGKKPRRVSALALSYMFQTLCMLPSSWIRILWIMIMATTFFLA